MTETEQIKVPLPDSLMKAIQATMASPGIPPREKFEAVVLIAHGYGLFIAKTGSIDPMAYAIPETQWSAISEMLMTVYGGDSIGKVNLALDWMNIGPSSYKPEPVEL